MKPKHQRLIFILASIAIMATAASVILYTFRENLVFFVTPTQLYTKLDTYRDGRELRLGGLVKIGSIDERAEGGIRFVITDLTQEVVVDYQGLLPTLFREGQGVVATGTMKGENFIAREILAKHDENYMPKEVAEALKKSGRWKEGE